MNGRLQITRVYPAITRSHIRGQEQHPGHGDRARQGVTPVDVARVVETAQGDHIPNDQRLLLVSRRSS